MDMTDNFQAKEVNKLNPSTVTALDYTIRVLGIPTVTDEAVAKVHLADTNMKEINLYFKGGTLIQRHYDCVQRV
eukprot:13358942-Ditylum_brightwellii.AAC.1